MFSQLQTTPQKVTYCLSIFKIMLGIFPYYTAYNWRTSGQKWPISCEKWPISKLVDTQSSDFPTNFGHFQDPKWPKVTGVNISRKIRIIKHRADLISTSFHQISATFDHLAANGEHLSVIYVQILVIWTSFSTYFLWYLEIMLKE